MLFVLLAPLLLFFKPRIPLSQASQTRSFDVSFVKMSSFSILQLGNVIESFGFFIPAIYLPSYARDLGAGSFLSTLTLILLNGAGCLGCVVMGSLVDRYHVTTCVLISTIGSTLAAFLLWGLSGSLAPLYIFSILWGLFAGCWASIWPGIMRDVQRKKENADSGMVFACLAAGKGIGNVASGPLSEALIRSGYWRGAALGYGSGYGPLIVFTGVTALCGGCSVAARRVGWL